jgi:hypothetical protein
LHFFFDSTPASPGSADCGIVVNGVQVASFSTETYPAQNLDTQVNSTVLHSIGRYGGVANYTAGLMALPILVDGAALDYTSFAEIDAENYINPIEFEGVNTLDLIPFGDGTIIGNATGLSGQAAAFNGVIAQTGANSAQGTTDPTYIGKQWSSPKIIRQAIAYSPTDDNFGGGSPLTVTLEGSTDNFSASIVTLGTISGIVNTGVAKVVTFNESDLTTTTAYEYHRFNITGGGSGSKIAEAQFFAESATSGYGTNGGAYDFADSADFGYDVSESGTITGLSSYSPVSASYINDGSVAFTIGTGTLSRTSAYNAIRSSFVLTGDFSLTANITSGATGARFGVYAANEDSTWDFDEGVYGDGGTRSMSKSYYVDFGSANFFAEGSTHSSTAQSTGVATITRVGSTITLTSVNGAYSYSDASAYTGPMRVMFGGGAVALSWTSIAWTSDGLRGNSFEPIGFVAADQVSDTPTDDATLGIGNYCTWSASCANGGAAFTLSEANTKIQNAAGQDAGWWANIFPTSGKWYFETTLGAVSTGNPSIGVVSQSVANSNDTYDIDTGNGFDFGGSGEAYAYHAGGDKISDAASVAYGSSYTTNDIIGVAVDLDNHAIWFSKNGTWQASATTGEIAAGTTTNAAFTGLTTGEGFAPFCHNGSLNVIWTLNCGQKAFAYTPPTGFVALATQNLPAPTIADGSDYFNTVLYTGNGTAIASGGNPVTGVGFQPDFIWLKDRTSSNYHQLYDVVRGAQNAIYSNDTLAEGNFPEALNSIDSNGFTLGNNTGCNNNTNNYVAWCWKAGGTAVTNTDGTITSSVSANPTAGFSIVTWTGTGVAATVGHGLGVPNDFMIFKSRSNVSSPGVVTSALGFTKDLLLETTDAAYTRAAISNNTAPTSTVFSVGTDTAINVSGYTYVAYCWAEVEGFSKFSSYIGNGSTNGPFVYTGFRPAFLLFKSSTTAQDWNIIDVKRDVYNVCDARIRPNSSAAEVTDTMLDITSTGFKLRATDGAYNGSGATYIYAAFAEHPFQGDAGVTQGRAR